jgi:hypothetical protein
MENSLPEAKNFKLVLCAFENLSGASLKINFQKSELFCLVQLKIRARLFGCVKKGILSFGYLEIPMHYHKIRNKDRMFIEKGLLKKLGN